MEKHIKGWGLQVNHWMAENYVKDFLPDIKPISINNSKK
jgi:hypothetical protein